MAGVTLSGVSKSFLGQPVLRAVDLEVATGRIAGVVGPNGSGKTTLFSVIGGFLRPDSGEVRVDGQAVGRAGAHCGRLGILPQDARFLPSVSLGQQFRWYARLAGFDRAAAAGEVTRVLGLTGLADCVGHTGGQLSHGMHKRAAIAQALIGDPPVVVLDEPTAGLDPANTRRLREFIDSLRGQRTVLISSHDLEEIGDLCDDITVFDRGRLVAADAMQDFTGAEGVLTFCLTRPAPQALVAELEQRPEVHSLWPNADGTRLACQLPVAQADDPQVIAALLAVIQADGGTFWRVTRGSTLEDRFLEVTEGEGAASHRPDPAR